MFPLPSWKLHVTTNETVGSLKLNDLHSRQSLLSRPLRATSWSVCWNTLLSLVKQQTLACPELCRKQNRVWSQTTQSFSSWLQTSLVLYTHILTECILSCSVHAASPQHLLFAHAMLDIGGILALTLFRSINDKWRPASTRHLSCTKPKSACASRAPCKTSSMRIQNAWNPASCNPWLW